MKLLICADMEGVTGVTEWNHVSPSHAEYPRFRRLMTADVNAAVRGAFEGGATEIIVADGHNLGTNILIEELDPRARLNGGTTAPLAMVQGIQDGPDAVFFVGYHARNGTQNAILDHTWSSSTVADVWLNGRVTGEIGLNAGVCGHFGVPVLLVTGDQSAGAEAREWLPGRGHGGGEAGQRAYLGGTAQPGGERRAHPRGGCRGGAALPQGAGARALAHHHPADGGSGV